MASPAGSEAKGSRARERNKRQTKRLTTRQSSRFSLRRHRHGRRGRRGERRLAVHRPDAPRRLDAGAGLGRSRVASLTPGMSLTVKWRGKPVVMRNRTDKEMKDGEAVNARRSQGSDRPQRQSAGRRAGDRRQPHRAGQGKLDGDGRGLHASRLHSARPAGRIRRLVLPVPRLAIRHGRPHPQRPGAREHGRSRYSSSFPTPRSGSVEAGDITMSEWTLDLYAQDRHRTLVRRAHAAAAAGL